MASWRGNLLDSEYQSLGEDEPGLGLWKLAPWRALRWKTKATLAVSLAMMSCVPFLMPSSTGTSLAARRPGVAAVVTEELAKGRSHYNKVQYLGFNLFTAPGTSADGCLGTDGESTDACYLGDDEVRKDLLHRQQIMEEALERAHSSEHWDRAPTTLKVFMAPEFYWRGAKGAYTINGTSGEHIRSTMLHFFDVTGNERFRHWLICFGTVVLIEAADKAYIQYTEAPWATISYYNFAPIHFGGTDKIFLEFKHFVSGVDFLKTSPDSPRSTPMVPAPPKASAFCKEHPQATGCIYNELPYHLLNFLGLDKHEILKDSVLEVGNLSIGVEICLDHAMGRLARDLGEDGTVDVQLIMSAGMNIRSGPVVTEAGGPVFLADGFARTEMNLNMYGKGRDRVVPPSGHGHLYNVGTVYGSDSLVAIFQWLGDAMDAFTGTGFGVRVAGQGTLPGGSEGTGPSGIEFQRISALGEDWFNQLDGFYNTASYIEAQHVFEALRKNEEALEKREGDDFDALLEKPHIYPTIDIYGPIPVPYPVH